MSTPDTLSDAQRHPHRTPQLTPRSVRTKERASLIVYWPGINNDIDNIILSCTICQDMLPSNPREPIISKQTPTTRVGSRLLLIRRPELVDRYTDWPDILPMGQDTSTPKLISVLQASFCHSGVSDTLWSDQGPQFTSK